jgi:hypothetical protein
MRFVDQGDIGDTYTFDPSGPERDIALPVSASKIPEEKYTRLNVRWENLDHNHRVRLHIKLPLHADHTIADTPYGDITRPAVPDLVQGRDRLNGYPASKFIVAGGVAILLDRTAEFELIPETNELAITMVRAHGWLSADDPQFRPGGAGPHLKTHGTQMHQEISWNLGIMPWNESQGLPWREWEDCMLNMLEFEAPGGGTLAARGSYFRNLPKGILSAVLPEGVRVFEEDAAHSIVTAPLDIAEPARKQPQRGGLE